MTLRPKMYFINCMQSLSFILAYIVGFDWTQYCEYGKCEYMRPQGSQGVVPMQCTMHPIYCYLQAYSSMLKFKTLNVFVT